MFSKMIKCPYCGYDGNDLKKGRRMPVMTITGVAKMICSRCKREFILR
jgi:hypothetical protein